MVASSTRKKKVTAFDPDSIAAMMTAAVAAHEKGDLEVAERGYRAVLAAAPNQPDALQLLGVARHQQGASLEALELLGKAKALAPRSENVRANLASVLNALKRYDEAAEEFRAALAIDPRNGETWCNLGIALRASGKTTEAIDAFERAMACAPKDPKASHELAGLFLSIGDYRRCEVAYRAYLALVPDDVACISNLAYALQSQNRMAEAEELFGQALDIAVDSPEIRHNLRVVLKGQGRSDEARAQFRELLKTKPELWTAELGLALNLLARGQVDEAMATIGDILEVFPDKAEIRNDIGVVLLSFEKFQEAAELFKRASELDPSRAMFFNNYGGTLVHLFRYEDAIPVLLEAIRLKPDEIPAYLNLARVYRSLKQADRAHIYVRAAMGLMKDGAHVIALAQTFRGLCDFDSLDELGDIWEKCGDVPVKQLPGAFLDLLVCARTRDEIMKFVGLVRRWSTHIEAEAAATALAPLPPRKRAAGEKLRIGFLSADLRTHSVARFMTPVLQHYDRSRFSFHCYTPIPVLGDPLQVLFQQSVDSFKFINNKGDREAAQIIRDDGIDILFELNGFTEASRLPTVAWKPAPVQISWLGYPFTCGLKALDHVLIDQYAKPADPSFMTEEPIVMPEAWVCFGKFTDIPVTPTLPVERNGYITFGTLNSPYKYNREVIAAWARVMKDVPNSRFLIVRPEANSVTLASHIAREFEKHGVSPDRLYFFDNTTERKNHLEYYNAIDISLDTFPLTGGTTTCDATWMGVPVVSLVGESFHQRISYSVLMQCGLEELCTFTVDDFVARAIALANDVPRLRAMRQGLRDVLRASPLCDETRFLHQFQEMLEQVATHYGIR